jgi:hypothetical protein
MLFPCESSTQTLALIGSAMRTGSPSGTRITRVAHPLLMFSNATTQAIFEIGLLLCVLTGLVLSDDGLDELEDRSKNLLYH